MVERFFIEPSAVTPLVEFDRQQGIFKIQGKSLPEDVKAFYMPLLQWWDEYRNNPNDVTNLILDFDYFNTASSKMILLLLSKLKDLSLLGKSVRVTWCFPSHDSEMEEAGEELAEILNIPFDFIPKSN